MKRLALLFVAALVIVGMAGAARAQTNTPTDTPVNTATATATATFTATATRTATATATPSVANPATPGSSDQAAWKYGSFKVATPVCPTPNTQDIIIPGLKQGDLIEVYPSQTYVGAESHSIFTNNTLRLHMACSTAGGEDWQYIWYNRTQNNCQGAPNCRPAPTVTPTPT